MENIIIVTFGVESEGYQALSELKNHAMAEGYLVSQAVLGKNKDGHFETIDSFDTGVQTRNDTQLGGIIGALMGVAGGPLGMMLMGSYGALVGSAIDWSDAAQNASLMEHVLTCVTDENPVIIAMVEEESAAEFDRNFEKFSAEITRFDAAEVAAEVAEAERIQEEMAREAKQKLREAKKEDRRKEIEAKREKVKAHFADVKAKIAE